MLARAANLEAVPPDRRISVLMEDSENDDAVRLGGEVDAVWEATDERALNARSHGGGLARQSRHFDDRVAKLLRELIAKSGILVIVPARDRADVELGVRP